MSDLISRQDAIVALTKEYYYHDADYMTAISVINALPSAHPNLAEVGTDLISRHAAIDVLNSFDVLDGHTDKEEIKERIERLPSVEQEAIPLEWINKHLEWLDNCDNDFAQMARIAIRAMVDIWKKDKI